MPTRGSRSLFAGEPWTNVEEAPRSGMATDAPRPEDSPIVAFVLAPTTNLRENFGRFFADWWCAGRDGIEQGKFLGSADALTQRARPVAPHLIKHWLFPAEPGATAPAYTPPTVTSPVRDRLAAGQHGKHKQRHSSDEGGSVENVRVQ